MYDSSQSRQAVLGLVQVVALTSKLRAPSHGCHWGQEADVR